MRTFSGAIAACSPNASSAWGRGRISRAGYRGAAPRSGTRPWAQTARELHELLAETNGTEGEYGLGLLWSAERIAQDNAHFRSSEEFRDLYMPFEGLVFFADAGNGDQFAVSLSGNHEVYVWNHEDDSRTWVAATILGYLEAWMTGRLTV